MFLTQSKTQPDIFVIVWLFPLIILNMFMNLSENWHDF